MIVEIIGIKNGKIVRRIKREVSSVGFDENTIFIEDTVEEFSKYAFDRLKLIVDGEEWINKVFLKLDFQSYIVGNEYEVSDDQKCWRKMELVRINEDEDHPFTCKNTQGLLFGWRFARELF